MEKKIRQPRKLKKAIKNTILVYDVTACPGGMNITRMWEVFQKYGLILYDSQAGDDPILANRVGKRVQIINTKNNGSIKKRNI